MTSEFSNIEEERDFEWKRIEYTVTDKVEFPTMRLGNLVS